MSKRMSTVVKMATCVLVPAPDDAFLSSKYIYI